jgi:hypothetical protein
MLRGLTAADEPWELAAARAAARPGSHIPHTVVVLPSYSVAGSLLGHYAARLLQLEHRQLLQLLTLARVPGSRMVFVTSSRPSPQVVDYYLSLLPRRRRRDVLSRLQFLEVPDPRPLSVSAKLLDRPDLVAELRHLVRGRVAYIDPWNVTEDESRLAHLLGLPLNGTPSQLWSLGFKSSGRRILRAVGVPVPFGYEDLRSGEDVVAAVEQIAHRRPGASAVVVKTDNSGAGDGNRVVRVAGPAVVRSAAAAWEPWYHDDLSRGAVVEELLEAPYTAYPSVQVNIAPTGAGEVEVVSTHEQLVGGPTGHVYLGCTFPANPAYAAELADYGSAVGRLLAEHGAVGRLAVDFAATREPHGRWQLHGLEINLRRTGTTHPLTALESLVPGRYHPALGHWVCDDGTTRSYRSTDNLVVPRWRGAGPGDVVDVLRDARLHFDRHTGTGVVLHAFCGLDADGRLGLTAIGTSPSDADRLYRQAEQVLDARDEVEAVGPPMVPSPRKGDAVDAAPA